MSDDPKSASDVSVWEKLAQELTSDPLKKTRDTADKWTNILSALVGLSTVFGLIQGRDALSKLSIVFQIVLVVVFLLALLVSVRAIYLATLASEGTPGPIPLDKKNFFEWYRQATNRAISYLQQSRRLALVAVALVVLGLFITWFAPSSSDTRINILVIQKSGTVLCGVLDKDSSGNLVLTSKGKPVTLHDIVSIKVVTGCP
jgi:hypothetical protein